MKKIAVIATGRADYGHLYFILRDIEASDKLDLVIFAPGNHHCINEMLQEFKTVQMTPCIKGIQDYGEFFTFMLDALKAYNPDMVLVLGDRFEVHAAATAALLLNIPIAHIHGGESTKGAFDDNLRNSITMMADYHFTAHWEYSRKVCEMSGLESYYQFKELPDDDFEWEDDGLPNDYSDKVYTVGAPGLDWITRAKLLPKHEINIGIDLDKPFIIGCMHPVTRELEHTEEYTYSFLQALIKSNMQVILIQPNVDPRNEEIRKMNAECASVTDGWVLAENLPHLTYLSLLQYASLMVGNSSSGIIEAASFNLPVINIGSRQEGRITSGNVFHCGYSEKDILAAIGMAREWKQAGGRCENVYGKGNSSKKIVEVLENI